MLGFCDEELKLFGPAHVYDDAPFGPEVKFSVVPEQTGLLLDAVAAGAVFTFNVTLLDVTLPQAPVTITL
jgi:hypothetical protein